MKTATFDTETNGLLQQVTRVWCAVVKDHNSGNIKTFNPDHVIITLGDNLKTSSEKNIIAQYSTLIKAINHERSRKCTLVTPNLPSRGTKYKKSKEQLQKIVRSIQKAAQGKCRVIESAKQPTLTRRLSGDGVHLTSRGYIKWGKAICNSLQIATVTTTVPHPPIKVNQ